MDVTTAARFHIGERFGSSLLRLAIIPLLGFDVWNLVVYDMLVCRRHSIPPRQRLPRPLGSLASACSSSRRRSTSVHHSNRREETDSNYSTVLSVWDQITATFRMR